MDKEYLKNLIKFPISRRSRALVHEYRENVNAHKIKLIMTLVIRNEETMLEKNIRFHHAMGVDGFIVTNHNSTDKTAEILEKLKNEGLVLEILYKDIPNYQQALWVNQMIKLAKHKYHANWVINADADEFYYSKDLDLKTSIYKYSKNGINALFVDSNMSFPQNIENIFENKYWCTKSFQEFEKETFKITDDKKFANFIYKPICPKIIHATKRFISISMGNHKVKMWNLKQVPCSEIILYHYNIGTYKNFEAKVLRWLDSAKTMKSGNGEHVKEMVELYKAGRLKERFDDFYGNETREFLTDLGMVTIDKSVYNFLKYKMGG
jgi:ribosome biogenesis protein Nip4